MRISDWSSDVCSSDLLAIAEQRHAGFLERGVIGGRARIAFGDRPEADEVARKVEPAEQPADHGHDDIVGFDFSSRSEEHTSELQSLMRISYAVFCLKKKKTPTQIHYYNIHNQQQT